MAAALIARTSYATKSYLRPNGERTALRLLLQTLMLCAGFLVTVTGIALAAPVAVQDSQSGDATALTYQRRVFRDSGYFLWAFYFDGTDTRYERSDDTTGASWTGPAQLFSPGQVQPSIWFDSDTVWVAFSSGGDILIREGIVSGITINWSSDYIALSGDGSTSYTRASVCRGSDGLIWITARVQTPSGSHVCAVRSTAPNDISSWQSPEAISPVSATGSLYALIVPLNDGDVYIVWNREGWIEGKRYVSGSGWEAATASIARGVQDDPDRLFSAVSDRDGRIHLLYVSRFTPVCYRNFDGTTWGPEQVLSAPFASSPTLSINPTNQRLYALWIEDRRTECRSAVLPSSSNDWREEKTNRGRAIKAHVLSCYSSDSRISWLYTQGRRQPFNVTIDGLAVARVSVLVSVSSFVFGVRPLDTWLAAESSQVINDGTCQGNIYASLSQLTSGPLTWDVSDASNGPDVCRVQWSNVSDAGPWNDIASYDTEFLLASGLDVGNSVTLYLRMQTPTSTSSYNEYAANLTIRAEE
jgi:hypothetical protein